MWCPDGLLCTGDLTYTQRQQANSCHAAALTLGSHVYDCSLLFDNHTGWCPPHHSTSGQHKLSSYKTLVVLALAHLSTRVTAVWIWNPLPNVLALLSSFCPLHIFHLPAMFFTSPSHDILLRKYRPTESSPAVLEILAKLTSILSLSTSLQE